MKKSKLTNLMLCVLCVVFAISATLGIASALRPNVKASAAVETKKVYLMQDGVTDLNVYSGAIENGAWSLNNATWTNYELAAFSTYSKENRAACPDMSYLFEKGAQLCLDVKTNSTDGSYAEIGIITYNDWWHWPMILAKKSLTSTWPTEEYSTVRLDLTNYIDKAKDDEGNNIKDDEGKEIEVSKPLEAKHLQNFNGIRIQTGKSFSIKNIWFEYQEGTADANEDVEVLTEAKTSKYVQDPGHHIIEVDLSAYGVMPYDTIEIGYSYTASSPNTRSATVSFNGGASCSVGIGTTTADNLSASGTATVELDSYTQEQLTSISVACWVSNWKMTSLKIVRGEAPVESSNFALIEASELVSGNLAAGNATTSISDDGVWSLAPGVDPDTTEKKDPDTTGKYTARIINLDAKRLQTALYNEGVITFSYKAPAEGGAENFDLRLMNMGVKGDSERIFTVTPVTLTNDGEWHEATVKLTDVARNVVYSTWDGAIDGHLNMDAIVAVGFGLTSGSVELKDFNVSYEAKDRTITGIEVATQPTKTVYYAGDKFDPTGLELNLVFSDGFKIPHYEYSFSDAALLGGATSVEIKSGEYTASVAITVENPYSSIAVTTDPTKTEYFASEKFDPTGMVVTASLKNGTTEEIKDYTYSTDVLTEGDTKVVISYMGMTAEVEIVVKPFEEKYTNKLSMFDASYVGADGKLLRGYQIAPESDPASEVVKTDAETYLKLFSGVTTALDTGKEVYKTCVRFIQYEVAYWNINEIYQEMKDAVVVINYRTTATDNAVFGLINRSEDWNVHYKGVNLDLEKDGEWHVAYVNLEDLYGEYTHHGWWSDLAEYTNFSAIDGFAFMVDAPTAVQIDVQSVEICWEGDATFGFREDIFAPEFEYVGDMSFTATEGDDPIAFENLVGYDKFEGNVNATIVWSEGAIVDGKLTAGTHTVSISAKDSKGNAKEAYSIEVIVEAKQVTPPDSSSGGDSSIVDSSSNEEKPANPKGCMGSIGLGNGILFLSVGAVVAAFAKKRQKNND